jgi:hypothetical protein
MKSLMIELLNSKISRNHDRILYWNWCKGFVKGNPKRFRLKYKGSNFQLEERCNTIAGWVWLQGYISEDEK